MTVTVTGVTPVQTTPRSIVRPMSDYTPRSILYPPILSGVARVSGAWDKYLVCYCQCLSPVMNAAHSNRLIFNILLGFKLVTECKAA